jgi:molybdate transport system substrate-binding protein
VPVGSYTRKVLAKLPPDEAKAIAANVRSNEPDVGGVVGKVAQGAVDAGFVYATDVKAAGGELRAIDLPDELQPQVSYGVAVIKGAKHPAQAKAFVDGLLSGDGRKRLDAAGFLPPPGS